MPLTRALVEYYECRQFEMGDSQLTMGLIEAFVDVDVSWQLSN